MRADDQAVRTVKLFKPGTTPGISARALQKAKKLLPGH
jgi:hypothetical protein